MSSRKVVYKFKAKVLGGEWLYIKDRNNIPVSITTDKGPNSVLFIFRHRHPSIADAHQLGETLIAEPDMEATERLEERERQRKEEENERIQGMWWNN